METKKRKHLESGQKKEPLLLKLTSLVKGLFSYLTVEPFLLCYLMPNVMSTNTVYRLNLEKACRADLGHSEVICNRIIAGDIDDNNTAILDKAQTLVVDMMAWKQPLMSGIPGIVILFVGAWSDKTGNRKALMLIPILGEFIGSFGLVLATWFFLEWPLWVTALIEAIPPSLSGGLSIALMGSYSYIADVTDVASRTFRVGVVAVIVTLSIPIGTTLGGVLTTSIGYYGVFGILVFLYAFGTLYTYLRIHDVKVVKLEGSFWKKLVDFFNPKNVWDTFSFIGKCTTLQIAQIVLVVYVYVVIMGPVFGEANLLYYYTLKKFNMDFDEFNLFSTYQILAGLIGTTIAVTLFSKYLKIHDAFIGVIATTCKTVSNLVYGLAPNRAWFYSAPVFDIFGNAGVTAIRSLGTKIVDTDDVGKMLSLIGLVDALTPVAYGPIYSVMYSKTVDTFPGAFFILGAAMTFPAVVIFIIIYAIYKIRDRDVVKNPELKERYAHDNEVTSL